MSLWDGDTNLFLDEDDPRGLGLSESAYHFIGGLKKHARAYSAITAPTVNSYKRLKLGHDLERRDLVAGLDQLRLQQPHADAAHPGPGRIEDRTIDGSCNPYLAATAVLAAGLDGIENRLDPGEPNTREPLRDPVRGAARRGLETLPGEPARGDRRSSSGTTSCARRLGRGRDEDYVDYFVRVKRDEWNRYHEQVTPWEIKEYLTRF